MFSRTVNDVRPRVRLISCADKLVDLQTDHSPSHNIQAYAVCFEILTHGDEIDTFFVKFKDCDGQEMGGVDGHALTLSDLPLVSTNSNAARAADYRATCL